MSSSDDSQQSNAPRKPAAGAAVASKSAGSSAAGDPRWRGRLVKRFKLIDELGEGAMGRVFIAEDTILKRHVALKVLPAKFKDGRPNHRTERLIKEARSAASLEHPNAVSIYEIDQSGGVHYIAMELAEGGNLEQLVQLSGPMEVERACQLVAEAAEALAHAHKRGIVHRDVKPANLLLTRSGRCKVCDFGLAMFEESTDPEMRLKCVGTPNFIAPETAQGLGSTSASDIYGLGCTLFFMLTGRPPFSGTSARDVMKQHISAPLPDLRKWRQDIPDRLVAAIEQACAKDPAKRFDSADRFAKVLRTFTIPTGSGSVGMSGALPPIQAAAIPPAPAPDGSGHGSRGYAESSMAPISAAQLAAIMPAPEPTSRSLATPLIWAGVGTVAAVILIGVGVWFARQGNAASNAGGASAPSIATPVQASAAPVVTPAAPAVAAKPPTKPQTAVPKPVVAVIPTVAGAEKMINGSIEELDPKGNLVGWYVAERCKPNMQVMKEDGGQFLRLTNDDKATTVHADQKFDVDPSWKQVVVSAHLRTSADFKPGKGGSGVIFWFQDENEKQVGKLPAHITIKEVVTDWKARTVTADIPEGAKKLYIQCVISYTTGTLDFDDVSVVPMIAK